MVFISKHLKIFDIKVNIKHYSNKGSVSFIKYILILVLLLSVIVSRTNSQYSQGNNCNKCKDEQAQNPQHQVEKSMINECLYTATVSKCPINKKKDFYTGVTNKIKLQHNAYIYGRKQIPEYFLALKRESFAPKRLDNIIHKSPVIENNSYKFGIGDSSLQSAIDNRMHDMTLTGNSSEYINEGNFSHFYRICYENLYPIYLTTDSILEAFISNVNMIKDDFETHYISQVHKYFIQKIIKLISELKKTFTCTNDYYSDDEARAKCSLRKKLNSIEVFLISGANLMSKECGYRDVEFTSRETIKEYLNLKEKMKIHYKGNIIILGKEKYFDFSEFRNIEKDNFDLNSCIVAIKKSMHWFSINRLEIDDDLDLHYVWILAKLIDDSGASEAYKVVYEYYKYMYGNLNIIGDYTYLYDLIFSHYGFSDFDRDYLEIEQIRNLILDNPEKKANHDYFYKKKLNYSSLQGGYIVDDIEKYYFKSISLFEYNQAQVDLINNAVNEMCTNPDNSEVKERELVSTYEILYSVFGMKALLPTLEQRMKTEHNGKDFYPLRDHIDYKETLKNVSEIHDQILTKNTTDKDKIFEFEYYKLLRTMNEETYHDIVDYEDSNINNTKIRDPLYISNNYIRKEYDTTLGAVHLYRRRKKIKSQTQPEYTKPGYIPEVVVETKRFFYREMKALSEHFIDTHIKFEDKINKITKGAIHNPVILNRLMLFKERFNKALSIIDSASSLQLSQSKKPHHLKEDLRNLIYSDPESGKWKGWFADLYTINNNSPFYKFKSQKWYGRLQVSPPNSKINYKGAILYSVMKGFAYGTVIVLDEDIFKIMMYGRFNIEDVYKNPLKSHINENTYKGHDKA